MKVHRLSKLPASRASHVFGGIVPGAFISMGGISFHPPGDLAHADEARHVHDSEEIFVILQGKAVVHFDGGDQPVRAGDVMVIDPDENHHLQSDRDDPCIVIWLHAGPERHPSQTG
jgi:mannose-6-phosphate isomerase-like protein (cupin superfamily)